MCSKMEDKKKPKIFFSHPFDKWNTKREEIIERILEERVLI